MKCRDWSGLMLGVVLTLGVACRAVNDRGTVTPPPAPESRSTAPPPPTPLPTPVPSPTSGGAPASTITAVPTVSPVALPIVPDTYVEVGSVAGGFRLSVPGDWRSIDAIAARFGPESVVLADASLTSDRLLNGVPLDGGGVLIAFEGKPGVALPWPATAVTDTVAALDQWVDDAAVTPLAPAVPVRRTGQQGAYIRFRGDPGGLLGPAGAQLEFDALLLVELQRERTALFLLGTTPERALTFATMFGAVLSSVRLQSRTMAVAGDLGSGALISHNLQPGEPDSWLFTGAAGRYATISVRSDGDLDLVLALVDPSGATLATVDRGYSGDGEAIFDLLLPENGTYRVEVSEFFNGGGRYTVSVNQTDAPQFGSGGQLQIGLIVEGDLDSGFDDIWYFSGEAGDTISIVLTPESTQLDIFFELHGPTGERLIALDESYSGDPELLSGYALPLTGEYMIVVNSFAGTSGPYMLVVDAGGDNTANFYEAGDLLYGDIFDETLRPNEVHAWFFKGRGGHEINLLVTPLDGGLDLDIWLLAPDLQRLAMTDDNSFDEAETIRLTLPSDGEYVIIVRDFYGTGGAYRLSLDSSNYPRDAGSIAYDEPVNGDLLIDYADAWRLSARSGDVITITARPTSPGDLVLWLVDPDGRRVRIVDFDTVNRPESIFGYWLGLTGDWLIIVREANEGALGYELLIERRD